MFSDEIIPRDDRQIHRLTGPVLHTAITTAHGAHKQSCVSPSGTELCCLCERDTGIPVSTPVEMRIGYVEGVGQLCTRCR